MKAGLALFDFDGTITYRDSAATFYASLYTYRLTYIWRHIVLCLPEFIAYRAGRTSYMTLKRKRLQVHVGHLSEVAFEHKVAHFCENILPPMIKKSALERIQWHKAAGHEVWIVSASFDFLLRDWCRQQGIGMMVNKTIKSPGFCTFPGEDCNFAGKVQQIKAHLQPEAYKTIFAYGDTDGDQAMLALAHQPYFNYFK